MESVTLLWIVFYAFIGLFSIQFVRFAGPLAIGRQYTVDELYPTDESGRLNVVYRILAPTICCQLPVFIVLRLVMHFQFRDLRCDTCPPFSIGCFLGLLSMHVVSCGTGLFLSCLKRSCLF